MGFSRWRAWWNRACADQAQALEALPPRRLPLALLATSALTIHVALVLARWPAFCFPAIDWLPFVGLSACFLGFGIGCARSGRSRSAVAGCLPLLATQALLLAVCRPLPPTGRALAVALTVLVVCTLLFIPLGNLNSRLSLRLPHRRAYPLCLVGALLGVAVSALLALLWTPPNAVWALAWLGAVPLLTGTARRPALATVSVLAVTVGLMAAPVGQDNSADSVFISLGLLSLGLYSLALLGARRARQADRSAPETVANRAA